MKDGKHEDEEITLRDLSRAALERLVMKYRAKRLSDRNPADVEADEERKKLSDLHSEKKGDAPTPEVEDDDLPEVLSDSDSDEDSELEEEADKKAKKAAKKS
jgi:hypothetical protein